MTPSRHFRMLKLAQYVPTAAPTMDTVNKNRGWLSRNVGNIAGGIAGSLAGGAALVASGGTAAPATPWIASTVGGLVGSGVGGMWDSWQSKSLLEQATKKWQAAEAARKNQYDTDNNYPEIQALTPQTAAQDAMRDMFYRLPTTKPAQVVKPAPAA